MSGIAARQGNLKRYKCLWELTRTGQSGYFVFEFSKFTLNRSKLGNADHDRINHRCSLR